MARKWYVIHTYSGYENKVKANLEHRIMTMSMADKIFDVLIPKQVVTDYKGGGRKTTSEKKVFPGYILVQMDLTDDSWSVVRNTPGVTGFVGSEGKPVPLSRAEVEAIRSASTESEKPKFVSDFTNGESVKVIHGRHRRREPRPGQDTRHGIDVRTGDPDRALVRSGQEDLGKDTTRPLACRPSSRTLLSPGGCWRYRHRVTAPSGAV
jgi:transcriptional antiterminator NusG